MRPLSFRVPREEIPQQEAPSALATVLAVMILGFFAAIGAAHVVARLAAAAGWGP